MSTSTALSSLEGLVVSIRSGSLNETAGQSRKRFSCSKVGDPDLLTWPHRGHQILQCSRWTYQSLGLWPAEFRDDGRKVCRRDRLHHETFSGCGCAHLFRAAGWPGFLQGDIWMTEGSGRYVTLRAASPSVYAWISVCTVFIMRLPL